MDFKSVCRTCLGKQFLNPIFKNSKEHELYSLALYAITGLKVEVNDGLPQNMCLKCIECVNAALQFKQLAKHTETKLMAMQSKWTAETHAEEFDYIIKSDDLKTSSIEIKIELACDDEGKSDDDDIVKETADDEFPSEFSKDILESFKEPHSDPKVRVKCTLCQKELSVRSVQAHISRAHPAADRRVKCDMCDARLLSSKLRRHHNMKHADTLKCTYCKTEFASKEVLMEHVPSCTAKKKKRKASEASRELSECEVCHKVMQRASLRLHTAVKHQGQGPVCDHCGHRFGNKYRLNEHYRAKHGYDKFKCSVCSFQSASIMSMRNHERRHRGEKPFECETCGAKFHAGYLLAQHRHSHRTHKLVKCDQCPATFKANNSLHMHKASCHSAALYQCSECPRAYACRHYAVKHLRSVHRFTGTVPPLERITK